MALSNVTTPYDTFTDTKGKIISFGTVYIGVAGQDPETNPITCYWDSAGTIVAAQPLQIVNGYIVNSGTPSQVFTNEDYSIRVYDTPSSSMVYYFPNILAKTISGPAGGVLTGNYPNPGLADASVTATKYADNSIGNSKFLASPNNTVKGTYAGIFQDITAYQLNGLLDRIGELVYYSHPNFTSIYYWCNGATLSRTDDQRLFLKVQSLLGTQGALGWGVGDGSTTFTLPDYRNYFLRGYNSGVLGAFQLDAMQAYTANVGRIFTGGTTNGGFSATSSGTAYSAAGEAVNQVSFDLAATSARTSTETRPMNVTGYLCVVR